MAEHSEKRVLIVSNNVLSEKRNNGKTILSFIDGVEKTKIRQLYFHGEFPSVAGYSYFQITDRDVMRGKFSPKKRGRSINGAREAKPGAANGSVSVKKRTAFLCFIRDLLWWNSWKSAQLVQWLDEYRPQVIFFVAGDNGFPYAIVRFLQKRYSPRLITYITDDYIMPRSQESLVEKLRRLSVRKKMIRCVRSSDLYYTISPSMKKAYAAVMGKESDMLVNLTPSLYDEAERERESETIVFVYAGSLYYGRDRVIASVAEAIEAYRASSGNTDPRAEIRVYSNYVSDQNRSVLFDRYDCCVDCGNVGAEELKKIYNHADILLFAESFDPAMAEKTKYSLSTKVPEYLSLKKPILAVGPQGIGSMDYLEDCALCVNRPQDVGSAVARLLEDLSSFDAYAERAAGKFARFHDRAEMQKKFTASLFSAK